MRSISKFNYCIARAKKCKSQAESYNICILLAPTPMDADYCTRKFKRAVKHANKYVELANYYGGK